MMIENILRCYLSILFISFFSSFCVYMGAYNIQSRNSYFPTRFSTTDKNRLGLWKFFVASPRTYRKNQKIFLITVDGEKWAISHFFIDFVFLPIFVFILFRYTLLRSSSVFMCCFMISEATFAVLSFWIHIISNRILALPQAIKNTDAMLKRHIVKHLKKLQIQYPGSEYQFERIVVRKWCFWETKDIFKVRICRTNGEVIQEDTLAIKKSSRYYNGSEITFL